MKKKLLFAFDLLLCFAVLIACAESETERSDFTWQEQYDLGMRYLGEGNYEEAIIAFTAAIEIDPKQADAYLRLADAYLGSDDRDGARAVIERGLAAAEKTDALREWLSALPEEEGPADSREAAEGYPATERQDHPNGSYTITEWDRLGRLISAVYYGPDGALRNEMYYEYDENGKLASSTQHSYGDNDVLTNRVYDGRERIVSKTEAWTATDGRSWQGKETYTYPNDSTVEIRAEHIDDGRTLETFMTYALHTAGNYVETSGFSWTTGDTGGSLTIRSVVEYEPTQHREICSVEYDDNGNVTSESASN